MVRTLRAEVLKSRRLRLLYIATAVGVALPAMVLLILRGALDRAAHEKRAEVPWQHGVIGDTTLLANLALPTLVVLVTALVFYVEHRNNMWKQLRTTPRPIASIYAAKFVVIQAVVVLALLIAFVTGALGWQMLPAATRGALPASDNVVRALLAIVLAEIFVALLPVAAIQFLLSARFANVLQPVGIGLGLTIASMLLWGQRTAAWFPYAYPGVVVMQRFGTLTPTSGAAATADTAFQIPAAAFGAVRPVRPVILVDHAHENLHTIKSDQGTGSLRWMLAPAKVAGIDVRPIADPWTEEQLRTAGLLIVAGVAERAASPAVSDAEVATLAAWVEQGGSLLLLTDHDPYAEALQGIARRFNVEFSGGMFADASHGDPRVPTSNRLYFSRANGLLGSHPLTEGVRAVITYGGQAVWRTEGEASRILALAPTARNAAAKGAGPSPNAAQLLAFSVGKGRVVIAGETAWFTAQITEDGTRIGVGDPMVDNGKLAVNTLRWLLGGN